MFLYQPLILIIVSFTTFILELLNHGNLRILFIILIFSTNTGICQSYDFDQFVANGKQETSRLQYVIDIRKYDSILDVEPKNHEVLILKGWTLYAIGEVESAKDRFDEVLSIGYDNLEAFWGKARCNLTLGYDYDAIKDMNMVLKLTPNSSEGLMLRGKIKMGVQDYEGGLLDYKTIINLKNNDKMTLASYNKLVQYYLSKKKQNIVLDLLDSMVSFAPNSPIPFVAKGQFYWGRKKTDAAFFFFNKAIELGGDNYLWKARCELKLERYFESIQSSNKGLIERPIDSVALLIVRGNAKYGLEDLRGAMLDYNKGIEIDPSNYKLFYHRGNAKLLLEDLNGACLDYSKSGELGFEDAYKIIQRECL